MISRLGVRGLRSGLRWVQPGGIAIASPSLTPTTSASASAASVRRCLHVSAPRGLGLVDSAMSFASKKLEASKDEKFENMIKIMMENPKWSMKPWKTTMENALSSWSMYIPGVNSSTEVVELKALKGMLDAMTEAELENPELIKATARDRIAKASGKTAEDVSKLMYSYKQTLIVHAWLQLKKSKGEAIPASQAEMAEMQERDHRLRPLAQKIMNPKGLRAKHGARGRGAHF